MDLQDLRSVIENMSDEELLVSLQEIRQNRRTIKPKAETKTAGIQKQSSMSLDDLLASAKANPAIAAQLLAALQGGRK